MLWHVFNCYTRKPTGVFLHPVFAVKQTKKSAGMKKRKTKADFFAVFMFLFADAELVDDRSVTIDVDFLEVVEKVSSLTDHLEQAATAVVVVLVRLEMLGQLRDAGSEDSDLNFGRTGVGLVKLVAVDYLLLQFFLDHVLSPFFRICAVN